MNPDIQPQADSVPPLTEERQETQVVMPEKKSCKCKCKEFVVTVLKGIAAAPLLFKIVLTLTFILFLWFKHPWFFLSSNPYGVFYYGQIHRLFTSSFMISRIYNLILALIIWVPLVTKYERSIGTMRYSILFIINTIAIQFLYSCLVMFALYCGIGNGRTKYMMSMYSRTSMGIIPYAIMELTMEFLANRKTYVKILFFPCRFHPLVYPMIVLILVSVINLGNFLPLFGVLYGVFYYYCLRNRLYFSDELISKCERGCLFNMVNKFGYVSVKDAEEYNIAQMDLGSQLQVHEEQ